MIIGMLIGSIVTGFAVNNSFQKDAQSKVDKYESLIQRIAEDNPTYVDDILCETDEWYGVYGEGAE
jgi:hypothetical protein